MRTISPFCSICWTSADEQKASRKAASQSERFANREALKKSECPRAGTTRALLTGLATWCRRERGETVTLLVPLCSKAAALFAGLGLPFCVVSALTALRSISAFSALCTIPAPAALSDARAAARQLAKLSAWDGNSKRGVHSETVREWSPFGSAPTYDLARHADARRDARPGLCAGDAREPPSLPSVWIKASCRRVHAAVGRRQTARSGLSA